MIDIEMLKTMEYPFVYILLAVLMYQSFQLANRFVDRNLLTKEDVSKIVSVISDEISILKEQNTILREQNTILKSMLNLLE